MKKFFGIILIITGIICIPQIITPSIYGTIGGIIGVIVVVIIPSYLLLRKKKERKSVECFDNDNANSTLTQQSPIDSPTSIKSSTLINTSTATETVNIRKDTLYESLFDELKDKCNPANFLDSYKDYDKSKIANNLYNRILNNVDKIDILMELRKEAMNNLNISFSVAHIYNFLFIATDPKKYTDKNYNYYNLSLYIDLHKEVTDNKSNIEELEKIYLKLCDIADKNIKIYNGREVEILTNEKIKKEKKKKDDSANFMFAMIVLFFLFSIFIAILIDQLYCNS